MTRIKKYQQLKAKIAGENSNNHVIWQQELQLKALPKQLLAIDQTYFQTIIDEITKQLNLINIENFITTNAYAYLIQEDNKY